METLWSVLEYRLAGIEVQSYGLAFLALLASFFLKRLVRVFLPRIKAMTERSNLAYDDILVEAALRPVEWACVLVGFWLAAIILPFPTSAVDVEQLVMALLKAGSIALALWFGLRFIDGLAAYLAEKASKTENKIDDMMVPIMRSSAKAFIVIVGLILVLQNLGYSVASLIAGLGIGGAALAFASKDTLSNLFGSLVIFLDRPFQVDDWIEMGTTEGTVEEIGLRTTRIRTFANSQITLPNALFTTTPINNWSRMRKRRIKMVVGLTYDTPAEKMEQAVEAIREIIANDEDFHHDFYIVNFDALAAHSLDIFIYCFTRTTSWVEFLNVKQRFLIKIMQAMESLELDFAFPTQTLHVDSFPGEPKALTVERPQ